MTYFESTTKLSVLSVAIFEQHPTHYYSWLFLQKPQPTSKKFVFDSDTVARVALFSLFFVFAPGYPYHSTYSRPHRPRRKHLNHRRRDPCPDRLHRHVGIVHRRHRRRGHGSPRGSDRQRIRPGPAHRRDGGPERVRILTASGALKGSARARSDGTGTVGTGVGDTRWTRGHGRRRSRARNTQRGDNRRRKRPRDRAKSETIVDSRLRGAGAALFFGVSE